MSFNKEVSSDHHEIDLSKNSANLGQLSKPRSTKQQEEQKPEHLKCPRCESTNTKFCYYNNYNKTQPRHFCKACKRHWTKGGTLRNVPVGGGQKNKRAKRPSTTTTNTSSSIMNKIDLTQAVRNQKGPSNVKTFVTEPIANNWRSMGAQNFTIDMQVGPNDPSWDISGCLIMNSTLQAQQSPSIAFGSSSLRSFDQIPTPVPTSLSSMNGYEVSEKLDLLETREDSTITSIFPSCGSSNIVSQTWQGTTSTTTNSFMDLPNYWN